MRKVKGILSIAICVMLVLGSICVPFTASAETKFNDVEENYAYYNAIYDLVNSGIIDGYLNEDGSKSFKPEATITRAEFSKLLAVTINKGVVGSATTTAFSDVNNDPSVAWAIPYIDAANKAGIINGYEDGTFRPQNPVSYAEAVKMVVCAIGYGPVAASRMTDVWYEAYINVANQIGITKSAAAVADSQAPRGLVAQLIYNMTITPPLVQVGTDKEGKPIYEQDEGGKLSGRTVTGLLKAVGPKETNNILGIHINGVSEGQIMLETIDGDKVFKYGSVDESRYLELLGHSVEVSYDELANTPDVIKIEDLTKDVYELNYYNQRTDKIEKEIINVSGTTLTYAEGNSNRKLGLDANMYLIYNGKGVGTTLNATAKGALIANIASQGGSMIGEGKFVDNDGDGAVDVAFVNAYETYYVSHKDDTDGSNVTITDANINRTVSLSASDVVIKKVKSDKTLEDGYTHSAISEGNIISVGASHDNSMKVIIISDLMAEGSSNVEVEELGSADGYDNYKIGSRWYKSSKYYANYPNQLVTLGSRGIFYLDFRGDIAAVKLSLESPGNYGYLVTYFRGSDVNSNNQYVQIWNSNTGLKTYEVSSNATVNGASNPDIASVLSASAAYINTNKSASYKDSTYPSAQLVKYKTGSGNKITSIAIVGAGGLKLDGRFEGTSSVYNSNSFTLPNGNVVVGNDTEVYFIPKTNRNDDKGYMFTKGAGYFEATKTYNVEAYDVKNGVAGALVVYGKPKLINDSTGVVVVKGVNPNSKINENGQTASQLNYYAIGDGTVKAAAEKDISLNLLAGIDEGDIVRIALDTNGEIEELEKVYDDAADTFFPAATTSNGAQSSYPNTTFSMQIGPMGGFDNLSLFKGTAMSKGDSVITIAEDYVADDGNGNIKLSDTVTTQNYSVNFSAVSVYVYNSAETDTSKKVQPGTSSNIAYYDIYKDPNDQGVIDATNASKIVAVRAKGSNSLSAIIIYK